MVRLLIVGVLLMLAVGVGYGLLQPKPVAVRLHTVESGRVEAVVSNTRAGTVKSCQRARLAPQVGGKIEKLHVAKGDKVIPGQVLLELWRDDLQAQLQLARQRQRTMVSHRQEQCTLAQLAQEDLQKTQALLAQGFKSPAHLQRMQTQWQARQAACHAADGELAQAKVQITLAEAGLERMLLRAPFAGIVADISGELGEYTTPSPPGVATPAAIDLIDDSCLFVSAPIDEVDAARLKVGLPARVSLDALKGQSFAAKVKRIAPYVLDREKQARTVEVEVAITQSHQPLLVGYSADVEIIHQSREQVLRVPTSALLEGNKVLLYQVDGILAERELTLGLSNWSYSEVTAGLKAGERIVLEFNSPEIQPGAKARPLP